MYGLKIADTDQVSFGPVLVLMVVKINWSTKSNMPYNLTPSPACYPFKMIYFICNGGAGTASQQNS